MESATTAGGLSPVMQRTALFLLGGFGMLLLGVMPLVVELGVLLDLFVAIFIICIMVNHINKAFASLDTRHLAELKE